jgi:hypothetical protein
MRITSLVPDHQEFGILGRFEPGRHHQTAERAPSEQVESREDHSAMISARNTGQDQARRGLWPGLRARPGMLACLLGAA